MENEAQCIFGMLIITLAFKNLFPFAGTAQ
jgi:hypothetical protein